MNYKTFFWLEILMSKRIIIHDIIYPYNKSVYYILYNQLVTYNIGSELCVFQLPDQSKHCIQCFKFYKV